MKDRECWNIKNEQALIRFKNVESHMYLSIGVAISFGSITCLCVCWCASIRKCRSTIRDGYDWFIMLFGKTHRLLHNNHDVIHIFFLQKGFAHWFNILSSYIWVPSLPTSHFTVFNVLNRTMICTWTRNFRHLYKLFQLNVVWAIVNN